MESIFEINFEISVDGDLKYANSLCFSRSYNNRFDAVELKIKNADQISKDLKPACKIVETVCNQLVGSIPPEIMHIDNDVKSFMRVQPMVKTHVFDSKKGITYQIAVNVPEKHFIEINGKKMQCNTLEGIAKAFKELLKDMPEEAEHDAEQLTSENAKKAFHDLADTSRDMAAKIDKDLNEGKYAE